MVTTAPTPMPATLDAAQAAVDRLNGKPTPLPPGLSAMPTAWHAALVRLGRASIAWRRSLEAGSDAQRMLALHELLSASESYERLLA